MNKKIVSILLIIILLFTFSGCTASTEQKIAEQQNALLTEASAQIGMPNITNFYEKKLMKQIFELRDDSKLICYAYIFSPYARKYTYLGRCMGYGIPYSTQFTNPETLQRFATTAGYEYQIVPQADPNGLYMPSSAAATWLIMIDEATGKTNVQYEENNVTVRQVKIEKRLCDPETLPSDY